MIPHLALSEDVAPSSVWILTEDVFLVMLIALFRGKDTRTV